MAVFVNYYLLTQLKTQLHLETALFNHENMIHYGCKKRRTAEN